MSSPGGRELLLFTLIAFDPMNFLETHEIAQTAAQLLQRELKRLSGVEAGLNVSYLILR